MGQDADVVRALLSAVARGDADAVVELLAEDFSFEPLSTEAAERGVYVGGEGMRRYLRDLDETWRQFDLTIAAVHKVSGHVVATGRIYARARETSLVADDPVAFAFRLDRGRVAWGKAFTSEAAAREALVSRA
jgi:ketosteroid isomerase-like protein